MYNRILRLFELFSFFFFFFQAEDGIRDYKVTGVQTCALPISDRERGGARYVGRRGRPRREQPEHRPRRGGPDRDLAWHRSEERRVGKECRSRWSPDH